MSAKGGSRDWAVEGYRIRWLHAIDAEALEFEQKLAQQKVEGEEGKKIWIPLFQQLTGFTREGGPEFRVLHIADASSQQPLLQMIFRVDRPRRLRCFGRAWLRGYGRQSVRPELEEQALRLAREMLKQEGRVLELRLQPYADTERELRDFHSRARRAGFELVEQIGVTRTLLFPLQRPLEEILEGFSKKTRSKLRSKFLEGYSIVKLQDSNWIKPCQVALDASMRRTGEERGWYDFDQLFQRANESPAKAVVYGLFRESDPKNLLAFVSAYSHGHRVEYSAAGALDDSELRKIPFNYHLLWKLIEWSQEIGAQSLDLGGVTDGGTHDRLAGISAFKRHFTEEEQEVGREFQSVLQRLRYRIAQRIFASQKKSEAPSWLPHEKAPLGRWFLGFALLAVFFSWPLTRVGNPESSSWLALQGGAAHLGEGLDFAIVGDSHSHTSLSPRVISETLAESGKPGLTGYNFAVDGTDVLHHFYFVREGLLKSHWKPKVLIYVPNALQFNGNRLNNRLEYLGPRMIPHLARVGAPLELTLDLAAMAVFPPYRSRPLWMKKVSMYTEIAGKKTLPIQERLLGLTPVDEPASRKYLPEPDGFEPFEVLEFEKRFERGAQAYVQDYLKLRLSDWHFELARLLLRSAREPGVRVVVVDPPVSKWFQGHLLNSPKHQLWRERLYQIAREEQAEVWDQTLDFSGVDSDYFGDPTHIKRAAAIEYSRSFAKRLRDYAF